MAEISGAAKKVGWIETSMAIARRYNPRETIPAVEEYNRDIVVVDNENFKGQSCRVEESRKIE